MRRESGDVGMGEADRRRGANQGVHSPNTPRLPAVKHASNMRGIEQYAENRGITNHVRSHT